MSRLAREGTLLNPSRETEVSGANGDREIFIFHVQLTTSRIGNLGVERRKHKSSTPKEGSDRVWQLQGPLSGGACRHGSPKNRGQPTWRLLRGSWDLPRETVWLPTPTLDNRYDVRRAQTSGTGADKQHFPRDLLHRSGKSIRLGRSCAIMGSTCPFWSSALDD